MTYRELLEELKNFSDEDLDKDVVATLMGMRSEVLCLSRDDDNNPVLQE